MHIYMYVQIDIHMHLYMCIRKCTRICICVHIYVNVCLCCELSFTPPLRFVFIHTTCFFEKRVCGVLLYVYSCVTCKWVKSVNESYHAWTSQATIQWVMRFAFLKRGVWRCFVSVSAIDPCTSDMLIYTWPMHKWHAHWHAHLHVTYDHICRRAPHTPFSKTTHDLSTCKKTHLFVKIEYTYSRVTNPLFLRPHVTRRLVHMWHDLFIGDTHKCVYRRAAHALFQKVQAAILLSYCRRVRYVDLCMYIYVCVCVWFGDFLCATDMTGIQIYT